MKLLHQLLISPPIFVLSRTEGQYIVYTGPSDRQIGAVLLKEQTDGRLKQIDYWSGSLTEDEALYSMAKR